MAALHDEHPGYNWHSNKGYGTPEHYAGLKAYGVCDHHHRRSILPPSTTSCMGMNPGLNYLTL